jgi:hypothetical protein
MYQDDAAIERGIQTSLRQRRDFLGIVSASAGLVFGIIRISVLSVAT